MKKILTMVAAMLGLATTAAADPAEGVWQTQVDDGAYAHVTISTCGNAVCGTIGRTFESDGEYESENIGRQIVIDMVPQGDGSYEGRVWRPSNDKIYIGKMDLEGDRLRLRGCVLGGLICSSQTWARIQ
ncbi:DUF2147 domain-containing protein [Salibaculum sp.]|uniref:DUF2147 domain-containing protein n=1 Tax=Salibaculum sp. TaxID=2855480 RepID=UPI002B4A60EA|nr:DUF2147 domain-containing protein [Salibaculum sp.]HKL69357.1 DUF2147 domain-containing protein [Salibaculum sp.]